MSTKQTAQSENPPQLPPPPRSAKEMLAEILSDWKWIDEETNAGRLSEYRGKHFAVVNRRVLGSDTDPLRLRERIAAEYHIHPERVVIDYMDDWDE
jgi:hypothetical protein